MPYPGATGEAGPACPATGPIARSRCIGMKAKRSIIGVLLCVLLAGCSGASPSDPAAPVTEESEILPIRVLDDARDIADQVEQRQADLEAAIP